MKMGLLKTLIVLVIFGLIAIICMEIGYLIGKKADSQNVVINSGENHVKNYVENVSYTVTNGETKNSVIDDSKYNDYYEKLARRTIDNVTMTIKEGTLTKTGATIIIIDQNEEGYWFGEDYQIQEKKNGEWQLAKPIVSGYCVEAIAWRPGKNGSKVNWSERYGELEKGEYRYIKEVEGNECIYVEFTIE